MVVRESDNGYISFIIKRLVQDHGRTEPLGLVMKNQIGVFGEAKADITARLEDAQFYFLNVYPINYAWLYAYGGILVLYARGTISALVSKPAKKSKSS